MTREKEPLSKLLETCQAISDAHPEDVLSAVDAINLVVQAMTEAGVPKSEMGDMGRRVFLAAAQAVKATNMGGTLVIDTDQVPDGQRLMQITNRFLDLRDIAICAKVKKAGDANPVEGSARFMSKGLSDGD